LACYGAMWSEKSTTLLGMTAPLMILAVPLLDVGLAIVRRFLSGQPIFGADHGHIHHRLLSKGLTPRRLVLVIYGVCGIGAVASLLLTVNSNRNRGFVIVLVCLAAWLGLQHLGYSEFGAAGRVVLGGGLRSVLSAQLALETFEHEVHAEMTLQQSWEVLCRNCPQFGFTGIAFHIDDVICQWGSDRGWQARLEFPGHGYISLWRAPDARNKGAAAVVFIDSVSRTFHQKLSKVEAVQQEWTGVHAD